MARNRAPYLNGFSSSQATLPKNQEADPFEQALQKHANHLRDIVKQETKQSFFYQRQEPSIEKYQDSYVAMRTKQIGSQISTLQASSISVKRPREINAFPKNDSRSEEEEKEMEYLKSSEYRKYLERIVQGVKNEQDLVKQMKEARNHNIYLDKSKQKTIENYEARSRPMKVPEIKKQNNQRKIEEQFQSITNLSMITAKEEILIIEPTQYIRKRNLTCDAYLEDVSNELEDNQQLEQSKQQRSIFNKISAIPHPITRQNKVLHTYSPCQSSELSFKPKNNKIQQLSCKKISPLKSINSNILSSYENILRKNKENNHSKEKKPLVYQDEIKYSHKQRYMPVRQKLQKEKSRQKNHRQKPNEPKRYYQPKHYGLSYDQQENYCQKSIQKSKSKSKNSGKMSINSIYAVDFKLSRPNLAQSNTSMLSSRPTARMYQPPSTAKSSQLTQIPASHSRSRSKSINRIKMSIVSVSSKAVK